jgi:hypothetical protein
MKPFKITFSQNCFRKNEIIIFSGAQVAGGNSRRMKIITVYDHWWINRLLIFLNLKKHSFKAKLNFI